VAHFLLIYTLADDYLAQRPHYRRQHLDQCAAAVRRGELVLGGALTEPADRAVLLFTGTDGDAARQFAADDPYVLNGLVERWEVREWVTVVGPQAAVKVN
jgi:uncharacterized protein